jgi:hypothetical protein
MPEKNLNHEIWLRVVNSLPHEVTFVLEPWGETYAFGPGEMFLIRALASEPGTPEIDFKTDSVTVCGWPGSTVYLFKDNEEIGKGLFERTRVPIGAYPAYLEASDPAKHREKFEGSDARHGA